MTERPRLAIAIALIALLLGLLGDLLLRAGPWGLNALVWTIALALAVAGLAAGRRDAGAGPRPWLLLAAVLAAAGLVWRDSPALKSLDVLAVLVLLGLTAWRVPFARLRVAAVSEYVAATFGAGMRAGFDSFSLILKDVPWRSLERDARSGPVLAAGRGIAVAVPLLVIFGALFMAADAVFENLVVQTVAVNPETIVSHGLGIGLLAWLSAGYLRSVTLAGALRVGPARVGTWLSLGVVEMAVILGLLNVLFLAFVIVQFRYFFGGADLVQGSTTLTYAQYARRGFFELVTVAALLLPLLLAVHRLLRVERPLAERLYRGLAGALVLLLAVIMVSALRRMRLYQAEYGLTELRLYTTAFMGWLALVFAWFVLTVLRGRRGPFAFGALVAALLSLAALHVVNPDALIVRTNVARAADGERFDPSYLKRLSDDGVPPLVRALPAIEPVARCDLARDLLARWNTGEIDPRTWSWSRARAAAAVDADRETLRQFTADPRCRPLRGID